MTSLLANLDSVVASIQTDPLPAAGNSAGWRACDVSASATATAQHPCDPQQDGHDENQNDHFARCQKDGFIRHHAVS
jgi:hypothetical protein